MLMNEGSLLDGCYSRDKDLTMPTSAHLGLDDVVTCKMESKDPQQRCVVRRETGGRRAEGMTGVAARLAHNFARHPRLPHARRKHKIFFAGKGSSGVRVTMQKLFENHPDFYFPHDLTHR